MSSDGPVSRSSRRVLPVPSSVVSFPPLVAGTEDLPPRVQEALATVLEAIRAQARPDTPAATVGLRKRPARATLRLVSPKKSA